VAGPTPHASRIAAWLDALDTRHRQPFRPAEFHKAVRALSARYVERRGDLPRRSPLDSAGKRAAFAGFYAPLHFFTVQQILMHLNRPPAGAAVLDLGCGTGVAGAACALAAESPAIVGIDRDRWALGEARWNWTRLGARGRTSAGDFVAGARLSADSPRSRAPRPAVVVAWSVNELDAAARSSLLPALARHASQGGWLLIVEPISRRASPWWDEWVAALTPLGARADEWSFRLDLPAQLRSVADATGLDVSTLKARSIAGLGGGAGASQP
jgi:hypothetical protein